MTINEVLKTAMKERKINQKMMACALDVKQSTVSRMFKAEGITVVNVIKLLDILGMELVVQPKTQGKRKEGSYVITLPEKDGESK